MEKDEAQQHPAPESHEHDHDHEHHHHDHEHHHEHEHHHHHAHGGDHDGDEHYESEGIGISRHEESLIGVFRNRLPHPYEKALEILENKMSAIAEEVVHRGGVIGHIKALVTAEGDRCLISITDIEVGPQKKQIGGDAAGFELVVIVFGLDQMTLHEIIRSAFSEYITRLS